MKWKTLKRLSLALSGFSSDDWKYPLYIPSRVRTFLKALHHHHHRHFRRSPDESYQCWLDREFYDLPETVLKGMEKPPHTASSRFLVWLNTQDHSVNESQRTIDSLQQQTYPFWHLVTDDTDIIRKTRYIDRRINKHPILFNRLNPLIKNKWVIVLNAGDILAPTALEQITITINIYTDANLIYADEDSYELPDFERKRPTLKPEWSPDLLLSRPYIGHIAAIHPAIASSCIHETNAEALLFNYCSSLSLWQNELPAKRISECLLHRPCTSSQTPPGLNKYSSRECKHALSNACRKIKHSIIKIDDEHNPWLTSINPGNKQPLISVIIPAGPAWNRRLPTTLKHILAITDYPNWEIITITDNQLHSNHIKSIACQYDVPVHSVVAHANESLPERLNKSIDQANGDIICIVDASGIPTNQKWLRQIAGNLALAGIGAVTGLCLFPDNMIAGTGLRLGTVAVCGPAFHWTPMNTSTFFLSPHERHNVIAAPYHFMATTKTIFQQIGPFNEQFFESLFDAEWCLRLRNNGLRIVMDPKLKIESNLNSMVLNHEDTLLFARALSKHSITDDPYLHPRLAPQTSIPTLRMPDSPDMNTHLNQVINAIYNKDNQNLPLDIYNDEAIHSFLKAHNIKLPIPNITDIDSQPDIWTLANWIITILRNNPCIRARFPHALSEGIDGVFAKWLLSDEHISCELTDHTQNTLHRLFELNPANTIFHLFRWRGDVRFFHPFALMPEGRNSFLQWLLTFGRSYSLRNEEIWWFLIITEEQPALTLNMTWLMLPEWQAKHPQGLTEKGCQAFSKWIETTYGINISPRTETPSLCSQDVMSNSIDTYCPGVNVIGHLNLKCGLQQAASFFIRAVQTRNLRTAIRDIPAREETEPPISLDKLCPELFDISIFFVAPFWPVSSWYTQASMHPSPSPYRIGNWYWEFHELPENWKSNALDYDEVWAPSRFIETAFRSAWPNKKIHYMPPGIDFQAPVIPRHTLNLPDNHFLFLFVFNASSCIDRKNPMGVIRAFQLAFPDPNEPVTLILKTTHGLQYPDDMKHMHDAIASSNVRIIDEVVPDSHLLGLINACDAYVSLHRSEGLGLTMAEAMMMGKPVIATDYSGNLDFMTHDNSWLVPANLCEMEEDWFPYKKGWLWAAPCITKAAEHMRFVYEHYDQAKETASKGQADVRQHFSMNTAAARYYERISAIHEHLSKCKTNTITHSPLKV